MTERDAKDTESPHAGDPGPTASPPPRDFQPTGDVGARSHSAFARDHEGVPPTNDERLAARGRDPGHDETAFTNDLDADRAARLARNGRDEPAASGE